MLDFILEHLKCNWFPGLPQIYLSSSSTRQDVKRPFRNGRFKKILVKPCFKAAERKNQSEFDNKMIYTLVALLACASISLGQNVTLPANGTVATKLGLCGYEATCSAGGYEGVCVSISSGCCSGGTVTSGLCPGLEHLIFNFK